MSCQDINNWPPVIAPDIEYYEERSNQNEIIYDQGQQVGHSMQDRQTGGHELAQAYAAAVSLAASRLQSTVGIADDIGADAEMPDLPEVLDLHQPMCHRNAVLPPQDVDTGSLFVLPPQDPYAGLPVLHFEKNTLLDFFSSPQDRQCGQRYIEGNSQAQPVPYSPSTSASQSSVTFCLESYNYTSLPLMQTNSHQQNNQNYPINHKQMLAQKYAAEELQNSTFPQILHHGAMDVTSDHVAHHQTCIVPESSAKDDGTADILGATIVGVDLSLSKSHANTSLCPQNRIPSQIVNRQDGAVRPPKKERSHQGRRSPSSKDYCGYFCDECGLFYERECTLHHVIMIEDQIVQPRSFASLPTNHLVLQNLASLGIPAVFGIFSKKTIPNRTVFGPMEGEAVHSTHRPNLAFPIFISEDKGNGCVLLDTKDDEKSNWMRFVRCATSPSEQNLVLIQQETQIYFRSIVQIEPKTELKVWYSDAYAHRYRGFLFADDCYENFDSELQFTNTDALLQQIVTESDHEVFTRKPKNRHSSTGPFLEHPKQLYPNLSNPTSTTEDTAALCDQFDGRRSKRLCNNHPQNHILQDILPYTAEKLLDPVEIIEHITQAIRDCGPNQPDELIANSFCSNIPIHGDQLDNRLVGSEVHNPQHGTPQKNVTAAKGDEYFSRCDDFHVPETEAQPEKNNDLYVDIRDASSSLRKRRSGDKERSRDEPQRAASKLTKFLQRHSEEISKSPEGSDSRSEPPLNTRSHELVETLATCIPQSKDGNPQPPLPQQKRLIKNIKNKHYVRADKGGVESPVPSEESVDIFEIAIPKDIQSRIGDGTHPSQPDSPEVQFITPLKKKCPESISHESRSRVGGYKAERVDNELQSSEVSSAAEPSQTTGRTSEVAGLVKSDTAGKREFPCLLCEKKFTSNEVLRTHSTEHRTDGGFQCHHCQRWFDDFMQVRRHIKLYHICPTTKSYTCDICGKTFCHTDKYKRHLRVHESMEKKFKCESCGKTLSRKDKLVEHMRNMHPNDKQEDHNGQSQSPDSTQPPLPTAEKRRLKKDGAGFVRETFHCDHCQKTFRKRGMLAQHYAKEHPNAPLEKTPLNEKFERVISEFPCPYCTKSYKSSTKRKQHILRKHPNEEVPQSYKTLAASVKASCVRCPWCPSQFTVRCKLYSHQRNKHRELLDVLQMTGLTEDVWERRVAPETRGKCLELLSEIAARCLSSTSKKKRPLKEDKRI